MKIQDLIENRIEKGGQHLNKEKQIMHINKGKEKMVNKREFIIIESDTSYDYFLAQTTSNDGSDHNPFQATSDESYDHNSFHVTSDESSDDTLKSCSEGLALIVLRKKNDQRTIYKGRRGSSFRNAPMTKPKKLKSRSKHLAPTIRTGSTYTTLVVSTKRPPPVTNYVLGLAAVTNWQQILNKEFGIISSKEDVGGSSTVRSKGKRNML
nr:hypothetical protein [Tanacetum cinerariifolium]